MGANLIRKSTKTGIGGHWGGNFLKRSSEANKKKHTLAFRDSRIANGMERYMVVLGT